MLLFHPRGPRKASEQTRKSGPPDALLSVHQTEFPATTSTGLLSANNSTILMMVMTSAVQSGVKQQMVETLWGNLCWWKTPLLRRRCQVSSKNGIHIFFLPQPGPTQWRKVPVSFKKNSGSHLSQNFADWYKQQKGSLICRVRFTHLLHWGHYSVGLGFFWPVPAQRRSLFREQWDALGKEEPGCSQDLFHLHRRTTRRKGSWCRGSDSLNCDGERQWSHLQMTIKWPFDSHRWHPFIICRFSS